MPSLLPMTTTATEKRRSLTGICAFLVLATCAAPSGAPVTGYNPITQRLLLNYSKKLLEGRNRLCLINGALRPIKDDERATA